MGCASQKYEATNLPVDQIRFGEGGGFTGAVTEYCLLNNGQIFIKKDFISDFKTFKKIKKSKAKKYFESCDQINIQNIQMDNPGDKYYFITFQTEALEHKVTWGRDMKEVPKHIMELYQSLRSEIIK